MINLLRKRSPYFLVVIIILISINTQKAEAFSFNISPVVFLSQIADAITIGVSNALDYLVAQKEYLIEGKVDPNFYPSIDIPTIVTNFLASTTAPASSNKKNVSGNPVPVTTTNIPSVQKVVTSGNNSQILILTNQERSAVSLASLSSNSILDEIASERADDLFAKQYFEHASPDGKSAVDLAKKDGYNYLLIGENLALGNFGGDQGIIAAWMGSPGHKANILNKQYTELGVAVKTGIYEGDNNTIAVQIFGLPLSSCPQPNQGIKDLIDSSTVSIRQMQADSLVLYNSLTTIKNTPGIDQSYYNQKIQEYNYSAKKANDAVVALKGLIDSYNVQVSKYNSCVAAN